MSRKGSSTNTVRVDMEISLMRRIEKVAHTMGVSFDDAVFFIAEGVLAPKC